MKSLRSALLICLATLLPLVRCASVSKTGALPATAFEGKFTLLYQGGRASVTEPCGCHSTPYGGIDREFNAVKDIRAESKNVLFVDAGNGLAPQKRKAGIEVYRNKARALIDMMELTTLQAYSPGPLDLTLGVEFLHELQKQAKFAFINTSLKDAKGQPLFETHAVIDTGGLRIAILGISPAGKGQDWNAPAPEKALESGLSLVRGKADWILVLSQLPSRDNEHLAEKYPEVQIVVGCDPRNSLTNPFFFNKNLTMLLDPHVFGYRLGKTEMLVKLPFKGFYSPLAIQSAVTELAAWEKNVADKKRVTESKINIERIKERKLLAPVPGGTLIANTLIGLDEKHYGQPNEVTALLKKYKELVRKKAL